MNNHPPTNVTPTEEDIALAKQLVAAGWFSTSNSYRQLRRWKDRRDEKWFLCDQMKDNPAHGRALRILRRELYSGHALRMDDGTETESMTLTIPQYIAFRRNGGEPA